MASHVKYQGVGLADLWGRKDSTRRDLVVENFNDLRMLLSLEDSDEVEYRGRTMTYKEFREKGLLGVSSVYIGGKELFSRGNVNGPVNLERGQ